MELLRREKGPSLGHMVAYYGSNEVCSSVGFSWCGQKRWYSVWACSWHEHLRLHVQNYTPEYGRVKATTENLVQEVGLRQRRCEFAHDYDRAMTWSCTARSQAFSPCTPEVGVCGSWTSGEERVSFCLAHLNYLDVSTSTGFYLISRMLLNVPKSS